MSQPSSDGGSALTVPSQAGGAAADSTGDGFVLERQIGQGGMGRVMAADDRRLGRKVAIKLLKTDNANLRARFVREARITALLSHPAIVPIYAAQLDVSGEPFYVMRLVEGESLAERVARTTTLDERIKLVGNLIVVADALAYAHSCRVIHRDLKPHNVILGRFGETIVIDWGLAKALGTDDWASAGPLTSNLDSDLTGTGDVVGTPAYMPPEQARGREVDERADVYAIGAMIYYALAGGAPYPGRGSAEILRQVVDGPPQSLRERVPGIPPELLAIVEKAMQRDPRERYSSAAELAADLRRFRTGQIVGALHYTAWERVVRAARRNRRLVTTVALLTAVALGVAGFGAWSIDRARRRAEQLSQAVAAESEEIEGKRRAAEAVIADTLAGLSDRLDERGLFDVSASLARALEDYYRGRPPSDDVERERLRSRAILLRGRGLRREGDSEHALRALDDALAALQRVGAGGDPPRLAAELDLALYEKTRTLASLGRSRDALEIADRRIALNNTVAERVGRTRAAQLAVARSLFDKAIIQTDLGSYEAARDTLLGAERVLDGLAHTAPRESDWRPYLANTMSVLGDCDRQLGHWQSARQRLERAVVLSREAVAEIEDDRRLGQLSYRLDSLATFLDDVGEYRAAVTTMKEVLGIAERRRARAPHDPLLAGEVADAAAALGNALVLDGDVPGGLVQLRRAHTLLERLTAERPQRVDWRTGFSRVLLWEGRAEEARDNRTQALANYQRSTDLLRELATRLPDRAIAQSLAQRYLVLGDLEDLLGRKALARAHFAEANQLCDKLWNESAGQIDVAQCRVAARSRLAVAALAEDRASEGQALLAEVQGFVETLVLDDPTLASVAGALVVAEYRGAQARLLAASKPRAAQAQLDQALDLLHTVSTAGRLAALDRRREAALVQLAKTLAEGKPPR